MNEQEIREYYEKAILWLPPKPSWRKFKFLLASGAWITLPQVSNVKQLRYWLVKHAPVSVYYSTSSYLSPEKAGGWLPKKGTYVVADNIIVDSDLVFDIDAKPPVTLDKLIAAKFTTLQLIMWLAGQGVKVKYVAFSGTKGFHVVADKKVDFPERSSDRASFIENQRKVFISNLPKNLKIDTPITTDPHRVLKLPNTLAKNGVVCTFLELNDLMKSIDYILNKVRDHANRPAILSFEEMKTFPVAIVSKVNLAQEGTKVSGRALPERFHRVYITSKVAGIKRHVPILKYKEKTMEVVERDVVFLINKLNLSSFLLFKNKEDHYALSLETFQPERIQSILDKSYASNKKELTNYGKLRLPIAEYTTEETSTNTLEFIKIIPGKDKGFWSAGHWHFFYNRNIPVPVHERMHGDYSNVHLTDTEVAT